MKLPFLLDTCSLLWLMEHSLPPGVEAQLKARVAGGEAVHVSPVAAWEIGMLVAHGRIELPLEPSEYFRRVLAMPEIRLTALSPELLIQSSFLPGTPPHDPFDRLMAATARVAGFTLVTRDRALLAYAAAGYLSALAC